MDDREARRASPGGGRLRGLRRLGLVAVAGAAALALAPAGAAAAPSDGCTPTPTADPNVTDWTCYWKPPTVDGYEVRQAVKFGVPKPPGADGHITNMEVDLVDQNFAPVPINRLMLHHIVFLNTSKFNDATCGRFAGFGDEQLIPPGIGAPERFYAAGEERAKVTFPQGYGYEIKPDHNWSMVYMFMNHRKQSDSQAWVQYKLRIDDSGAIKPARPYWLDVRNCRADPIYNVPGMHPRARKRLTNKKIFRKLPRRVRKRLLARRTHTRSADFTVHENGWIVGGAGHVHGGARKLTITKPSCGNLKVAQSVPTWGFASHPFYNVRPILHEPGPIGMSAFRTREGIPVRAGQKLRLNSTYDNLRPHPRVMGIYVVYLAEDRPDPLGPGSPQACGGAPGDIAYVPGTGEQGRSGPVRFTVPLTGLNANGDAVKIKGPPGRFRRLKSGARVTVGDRFFSAPNVRIRRGAKLRYVFDSQPNYAGLHNLTLANGPLGIGSANLNAGRTFTQRFRRAGVYRFFCGLHPVQMTQRVIVKKPNKKRKNRRKRR